MYEKRIGFVSLLGIGENITVQNILMVLKTGVVFFMQDILMTCTLSISKPLFCPVSVANHMALPQKHSVLRVL